MMDLKKLDADIRKNLYNPQNIFGHSLEAFEAAHNGELVPVSGVTPFANLILWGSTQAAISNDQIERAARRQLPEYANSINELTPHFDYETLQKIHAIPSTTVVNLVLPVSEMMASAIRDADGTRHLIIPRDAIFTYRDGTKFTLYHDVMIRVIDNDSMDIYYIDNDNPLHSLGTPIIEYTKRYARQGDFTSAEMISIPLDVYQFSTKTEYRGVTVSSGLNEIFGLTDQLYHVRVVTNVGGRRVELKTAHGDFKYNPNGSVATAVVQHISGGRVRVKIPDVYIERGLVGSEVEITIFETKGNISPNISGDGTFNFVPEFVNNQPELEADVNALRQILNLGAYSETNPSGGQDMPTLVELRDRVRLGNTNNDALTEDQLEAELKALGYGLSHEINYLGANVYRASSKLSEYTEGDIPTTIGSATLNVVMNDLRDKYAIIFPAENKVVVTPQAIINGGFYKSVFLTNAQATSLLEGSSNDLVSRVNNENLLSPIFYYLLDTTSDTPLYSTFDLDNPSLGQTSYMASNPQNQIKIATNKIAINKVKGSYYIHILTTGNDAAKGLADDDMILQLCTKDEFGSRFTINAKLEGRSDTGHFLFRAELQTGFNLGMGGTLEIENFDNGIYDTYHMPLSSKFFLNYIVTADEYVTTDNLLEDNINTRTLPSLFSVTSIEEVDIKLGTKLDSLFTPIKSSVGAMEYQTYPEDVLRYYEEDVYYTDEDGARQFHENPDYDDSKPYGDGNELYIFPIKHAEGDPVITNGKQEYVARKDDIVYDSHDRPIPLNRGDFNHLVTMLALDYKFALINYLPNAQAEIKSNLFRDIDPVDKRMIKDIELQYSLSNTVGNMEIVTDGSSTRTISNEITMAIDVMVDINTYKDSKLRNSITNRIKKAVSKHLKATQYVENKLIDEINESIKSSVISFKIDHISTLGDIQSFSLVNGTDNMGVKSLLSISDAGEYEILDGIDVRFISKSSRD